MKENNSKPVIKQRVKSTQSIIESLSNIENESQINIEETQKKENDQTIPKQRKTKILEENVIQENQNNFEMEEIKQFYYQFIHTNRKIYKT